MWQKTDWLSLFWLSLFCFFYFFLMGGSSSVVNVVAILEVSSSAMMSHLEIRERESLKIREREREMNRAGVIEHAIVSNFCSLDNNANGVRDDAADTIRLLDTPSLMYNLFETSEALSCHSGLFETYRATFSIAGKIYHFLKI